MYSKLHKRGSLPLPITIPESDLKHPVIDIELDILPQPMQPNLPMPSKCGEVLTQSLMGTMMSEDADVEDEDVEDGDSEVEDSQKSQNIKSLC